MPVRSRLVPEIPLGIVPPLVVCGDEKGSVTGSSIKSSNVQQDRRDWSDAPRTYSEVRTYRSTVTVGHPPLDSVEINSLGNTDDKHAFWPRLLAGAGLRGMCTWVLAALRSRAQLVACVHISHPREDRSPSRHVTPVH